MVYQRNTREEMEKMTSETDGKKEMREPPPAAQWSRVKPALAEVRGQLERITVDPKTRETALGQLSGLEWIVEEMVHQHTVPGWSSTQKARRKR